MYIQWQLLLPVIFCDCYTKMSYKDYRGVMNQSSVPEGIWKSTYTYPSRGRGRELTGEHYVRLHHKDNHLVFESAAETSKSYLIIRLSVENDIATGSWQEQTEADGHYKGVVYYGALQLAVSGDHQKMNGKWVGFGKDMDINVGPWELTYAGKSLPSKALAEHASVED